MVSQKHSKWLYLVADCWASPKNLRIKLEASKCMSLHGCQKLWLPSGIAVGSKCQINRRGWSWTQTWTLHPDQQAVNSVKVLVNFWLLWNPWISSLEFEFFAGLLKMQKSRRAKKKFQSSSPTAQDWKLMPWNFYVAGTSNHHLK